MRAPVLRARDRRAFILEYLAEHPPAVDVLDSGFVEAYVDATGAVAGQQPFGAPSDFVLRSTRYGSLALAVTGVGAGVLLVAAGYRLFRRAVGRA